MKTIIDREWLKTHNACESGIKWLKAHTGIGADCVAILDDCIKDAQWDYFWWLAPRCMTHLQQVQIAVFAAEQVIDIYEKRYPDDTRPRRAIETAKHWIYCQIK